MRQERLASGQRRKGRTLRVVKDRRREGCCCIGKDFVGTEKKKRQADFVGKRAYRLGSRWQGSAARRPEQTCPFGLRGLRVLRGNYFRSGKPTVPASEPNGREAVGREALRASQNGRAAHTRHLTPTASAVQHNSVCSVLSVSSV